MILDGLQDVIREADMDQNGSIDFVEFTALAHKGTFFFFIITLEPRLG